ncbi:MAG TPA: fibronectin type III domain-containing protein, partial [Planctomycetota bacterium]|nr:fibronectin type III domain-containing protein [Planctomycetota bacterium]
ETSTSANYMNLARPAVAVISIGSGQSTDAQRPRKDVVENVLLAEVPCVTVPPALVLQSEEGSPTGSQTSFAGYCVGNILISTNGVSTFTVSADGAVTEGPDERAAAGLPHTFPLDDVAGPPDTDPPVLSPAQVTSVAGTSATIVWTSDEPSTSIVRYGPTATYGATASAGGFVTSHSVTLAGLAQGSLYHYRVESADGAGNTTLGVDGTFQTGVSANYVPTSATVLQGSVKSGNFAKLATDNGSYFRVNSTTSGTRKSDWYGSATVPLPLPSGATLSATYSGKNSKTVTQTIHLWNWSTSAWVQLDSRSVGTSEMVVTVTAPSPAPFVSPTGEIRLRVLGTGGSSSFYASGDLLLFNVQTAGVVP